jgi:hypothetical protein
METRADKATAQEMREAALMIKSASDAISGHAETLQEAVEGLTDRIDILETEGAQVASDLVKRGKRIDKEQNVQDERITKLEP